VRGVFSSEEASRLGLPAFKALGASYAVSPGTVGAVRGAGPLPCPLNDLRAAGPGHEPVELIAATGRQPCRRSLISPGCSGLPSRIFFSRGISPAARAAIRSEATQAVNSTVLRRRRARRPCAAASAGEAPCSSGHLVGPGTSRSRSGSPTLLDALPRGRRAARRGWRRVARLVAVPVGRRRARAPPPWSTPLRRPAPATARRRAGPPTPCSASSRPARPHPLFAARGRAVTGRPRRTIMAGLNCGTRRPAPGPCSRPGSTSAVAVTDASRPAVREPRGGRRRRRPCGASSLAGVRARARAPSSPGGHGRPAAEHRGPAATDAGRDLAMSSPARGDRKPWICSAVGTPSTRQPRSRARRGRGGGRRTVRRGVARRAGRLRGPDAGARPRPGLGPGRGPRHRRRPQPHAQRGTSTPFALSSYDGDGWAPPSGTATSTAAARTT